MLFRMECSKRRASSLGCLTPRWLRYCIAIWAGAEVNDVNAVSGLSEPHGPDRAMADGGCFRTQISQPGPTGRLGQGVWSARRGARTDLALLADLCAPGLRHRPDTGRKSRAQGDRGGGLRNPVCLALALQEGGCARAAEDAAGGADVRSFRDAAARHGEDAAAGPRRLHHRLA